MFGDNYKSWRKSIFSNLVVAREKYLFYIRLIWRRSEVLFPTKVESDG